MSRDGGQEAAAESQGQARHGRTWKEGGGGEGGERRGRREDAE